MKWKIDDREKKRWYTIDLLLSKENLFFQVIYVSVKKNSKTPYYFSKNNVWKSKETFWNCSLSVPSSSHDIQKCLIHWYNRVHIPAHFVYGSEHFRSSCSVLERVCVLIYSIRKNPNLVIWWDRESTRTSRQASCLVFTFPVPLDEVLLSGTKHSFSFPK